MSLNEVSLNEVFRGFTTIGDALHGHVPKSWTQGRTIYGGMTAALSLMAAEELAQGRPLRSAFIGFVGPSNGTLSVTAEEVRSGRNASTVRSRLSSSLGPGVEALFTFAANRERGLQHAGREAPVAPPSADTQGLAFAPGAPEFTRNLEFVWACDSIPFAGGSEPLVRSWVRHREPSSREHPLALVCLADALPPAVAVALDAPAPMSSMTWMMDFLDDEPVTEDGWWLLEARTDFALGGHSSQDMTIWNAAGQCVAKGRQTITVFA